MLLGALMAFDSTAATSQLPGIIGQIKLYKVRQSESLVEIARRFDLGYNAIVAANPGVDPYVPKPGTTVTIPTSWIPPAVTVRPSVVVNLPEFRLYFFPKDPFAVVASFPLGIGDEGTDTPAGRYTVRYKATAPSWYPPKSIRRNRPALPRVVPPGPANPLGSHAIALSQDGILIHGTNKPWGVGRRASHGCLRLYPEDIPTLFSLVREGMLVEIVNQPVKIGVKGERVFVEVHRYLNEQRSAGDVLHMLAERDLLSQIDLAKVVRVFEEKRGVPVDVSPAHP